MSAYQVKASDRDEKSQLPQFAWPGGYTILYLRKLNHDVLCAKCASAEKDSDLACGAYDEGPNLECEECGTEIESSFSNKVE